MATKIKMKLKRHVQYGRSRYYPCDDLGTAILKILKGRTTFTESDVDALRGIGNFDLEIEEMVEDA